MTSLQQATLHTRRAEHQEAYFDRATHLQDAIVSKWTAPHCAHEHPTPHDPERPPEAKDFSRRSFAFPSIARLGIRGTPSSRVPRAIHTAARTFQSVSRRKKVMQRQVKAYREIYCGK